VPGARGACDKNLERNGWRRQMPKRTLVGGDSRPETCRRFLSRARFTPGQAEPKCPACCWRESNIWPANSELRSCCRWEFRDAGRRHVWLNGAAVIAQIDNAEIEANTVCCTTPRSTWHAPAMGRALWSLRVHSSPPGGLARMREWWELVERELAELVDLRPTWPACCPFRAWQQP